MSYEGDWRGRAWAAARHKAKKSGKKLDRKKFRERIEQLETFHILTRKDKPKARDRQLVYLKHIERTYGLGWKEYLRMFQEQGAKCAICKEELELFSIERSPVVDHCHATGKVRGLLCQRCNVRVGVLEANRESVVNAGAWAYIVKSKS